MAVIHPNIVPWAPLPTQLPEDWVTLESNLAEEARSLPHEYVLKVRFDAQRVGNQLRKWGLPWQVVMAGYLWESDKEQIRSANLVDADKVLGHIIEASVYIRYIKDEILPPLLSPPYRDLGGLLIAIAIYFHALQAMQEQSAERPYTGVVQSQIESVGKTLRNIATRLGMWQFKREIEDLSEQLRSPRKFAESKLEHTRILEQDAIMLEDVRQLLETSYQEATQQNISVVSKAYGVAGMKRRIQEVHTTALSQKTQLTGFDLVAFDVIVPSIRNCYTAFSILSQLGYIEDRVTDLIANPKANGCSYLGFGLILKPQELYTQSLKWPETYTRICQLLIATPLMQAIRWFGCLHPDCYQLYVEAEEKKNIDPFTLRQLRYSEEGKVFFSISRNLSHSQLEKKAPIVIFDKNHNPIALAEGATALDFAYALDSKIGDYAASALINNRKAPLYRILATNDIVEIRTSDKIQVQDYWLDENYARTPETRRRINESLKRRFLDRRGQILLLHELERYHYVLSPEAFNEQLRILVKQHNLGTPQTYLERLDKDGEPPYTPLWAAQEIMHQIAMTNETSSDKIGRPSWVPTLDMQLIADRKLYHQQRLCGFCQPIYPRDMKIMGRIRKHSGELIVHKESCPHLIDRTVGQRSTLLPMTWQLQPPAFRVAFYIKAQDRSGLVLDLTRELRQHQCDLLSINAEAVNKLGTASVRFTIETHTYKGVLNIWRELYKIENVTKVEIDAANTPTFVHDQLQKLRLQKGNLPSQAEIELSWSDTMEMQELRSPILNNPFDISRPATAERFFGRSNENEILQRELCESEQGKALLLTGPRRSGKSSICKNFLESRLQAPFWGTLFSLQNATRQNEETILMQLAERIGREFHEQLKLSPPDWEHYSDSDPQIRLRRFLEDCLIQVPESRLVLALDEFGGAIESYERHILDLRFFTYWKELIDEIPQLSLVIVLPTSSHKIVTSRKFVNTFSFAQNLPISFLDTESAKQLLVDPLRQQSIEIHPNTVALALKLTGGNPYYMTLIGQQLIQYLNRETQQQLVTDTDLRLVIDQLIEKGSHQNFDYLRNELQNKEEFRILEAIVELTYRTKQSKVQLKKIAGHLGLSAPIARRHLDRLRIGLILDENEPVSNPYYSFKIDLVRRWLTRNSWFFSLIGQK